MQKRKVPELRFPEFTDEWEEKKIGKITTLLKDGSHGTHKDCPNSNFYLLSAKNLQRGVINRTSEEREISEQEYHNIYKNYSLKYKIFLAYFFIF